MTLTYFSLPHILYILLAAGTVVGLYFLLRKRSEKMQRAVILGIMLLNVLQHLSKLNIYPQYDGGFNALSSAYNMCAALILASPVAYISKSKFLRDFVFYIGASAGIVAILVPYWNIGDPAFSWEIYRFLICHILLLAGSILPLLLGHHKPSWKCFSTLGLGFFAFLALIILNDIIFIYIGLYPGLEIYDNLYDALARANPVWAFVPPDDFPFVEAVAKFFAPDILVGDNATGRCAPVLWYFIPVYLAITLIALPICALCDLKNFKSDMKRYGAGISKTFAKIKSRFSKNKDGE